MLVEKLTCSCGGREGGSSSYAWCIKFDKKIVIKSKRKGYKEDFDSEELQAAIELYRYKEHEEEDTSNTGIMACVLPVIPATGTTRLVEELLKLKN